MSQTERQEEEVVENASNKTKDIRCLEHTLLGQSTRRHMMDLYLYAASANFTIVGRALDCKKVGHIVQNFRTPATNQQTRTCYECGSLGHYKSQCPIVKFHEHVDMIYGRMRASKPKTMQDAMEIATKLRNKKISTLVECETENKKSGSKPLCSKCNYHHDGPCAPKCHQCNRFGHLARDCRSSTNANTTNIQKGTGASQEATCYECGNQGHYRRDCPERKNQNQEDQIKNTKARIVVHAFGGGKTEQDLNNIEDEIEA
nr:hypothetical protein [Tanacetum cinerariifolium]